MGTENIFYWNYMSNNITPLRRNFPAPQTFKFLTCLKIFLSCPPPPPAPPPLQKKQNQKQTNNNKTFLLLSPSPSPPPSRLSYMSTQSISISDTYNYYIMYYYNWVVDTTLQQLQFQTMVFPSWGAGRADPDCYTASCVLFPTFVSMLATLSPSDKLPEIMFTLIQKVWSLQTASSVDYGMLSHL